MPVIMDIEIPDKCSDCPCLYETEGCFSDRCQLSGKNVTLENIKVQKPEWCELVGKE